MNAVIDTHVHGGYEGRSRPAYVGVAAQPEDHRFLTPPDYLSAINDMFLNVDVAGVRSSYADVVASGVGALAFFVVAGDREIATWFTQRAIEIVATYDPASLPETSQPGQVGGIEGALTTAGYNSPAVAILFGGTRRLRELSAEDRSNALHGKKGIVPSLIDQWSGLHFGQVDTQFMPDILTPDSSNI
jgi:hypothetical protein